MNEAAGPSETETGNRNRTETTGTNETVRGRDGPFGPPPARIRTGGITASGCCRRDDVPALRLATSSRTGEHGFVAQCPRPWLFHEVFPLAGGLPSTVSADVDAVVLSLFDRFSGTMPPCDCRAAYMSVLRLVAFPDRPCITQGAAWLSRFPCRECPHMRRALDSAGSSGGSPSWSPSVWPSPSDHGVGIPE